VSTDTITERKIIVDNTRKNLATFFKLAIKKNAIKKNKFKKKEVRSPLKKVIINYKIVISIIILIFFLL